MASYAVPTDRQYSYLVSVINGGSESMQITKLAVGYDADFWDSDHNIPTMPNPFVIKGASQDDYEISTVQIRVDLQTSWLQEISRTFQAYNADGYALSGTVPVGYEIPLRLIGGVANSYQWLPAESRLEVTMVAPVTINAFELYREDGGYKRVLYFLSVPIINLELNSCADLDLNVEYAFVGGQET